MRWNGRVPRPHLLLACALLVACSSKETSTNTDARPADTAAEAPGIQFETGAMSGAPRVCAEIRNCVVRCMDSACAQACVDQAPAAARAKYQEVVTCSKAACAETDTLCRCDRECFEPGECVPKVDECREGVQDDTFCDELCH